MMTDKELKKTFKKVPPLKNLKVGHILKLHHWWRGFVIVEVLETKKLVEQPLFKFDGSLETLVRMYVVKTRTLKPLPGVYKDEPIQQQIILINKTDYFQIIGENPRTARALYGENK